MQSEDTTICICTSEYAPVCWQGTLYSNWCKAQCAGAKAWETSAPIPGGTSSDGPTCSSTPGESGGSDATPPVLEGGAEFASEEEGGGAVLDGTKSFVRIDNSTVDDARKGGDTPGDLSVQTDLRLDNLKTPDGNVNTQPPGCGVAGCSDDHPAGERTSNANKPILVVKQEDAATGTETELKLRVGETEQDAVLEVTQTTPDGQGGTTTETNKLEVKDALADESCTADGSTCQVTVSVDKDTSTLNSCGCRKSALDSSISRLIN